jgi:hypothetical protein
VGLISNDCPPDIVVRTDVPGGDDEESAEEATEEAGSEATEEPGGDDEEASAEAATEVPGPKATRTPEGRVCRELVLNGDFEGDEDWGFPATSGKAEYSTDVAHSAERSLLIGYSTNDEKSGQSIGKQLVSIPGDVESAKLSYWYYPISNDPQLDDDVQAALIFSGDESIVVRKLQGGLSDERAWILQEHDLSGFIGQDVVLYFYVDNNGDRQASGMYLDEVSVEVCTGAP